MVRGGEPGVRGARAARLEAAPAVKYRHDAAARNGFGHVRARVRRAWMGAAGVARAGAHGLRGGGKGVRDP